MPAYATVEDVQSRFTRALKEKEQTVCTNLLVDAGLLIDEYKKTAATEAKKVVSCRMVIRALGSVDMDVPVGATQASMGALGYNQSWTIGAGGGAGEIYLSRMDKQLLGGSNSIGARSPLEDMP